MLLSIVVSGNIVACRTIKKVVELSLRRLTRFLGLSIAGMSWRAWFGGLNMDIVKNSTS